MSQYTRQGFLLLTPHLLERSPFKGFQPSVVRSLLPHCPAYSGLDCCLCGALHWHSVLGRSFPRSLVCSLLPWTMLAETAAQDPSCLRVSSTVIWWGQTCGIWISPFAFCAHSAKKQPPVVHWLCGGCTDRSHRECRARDMRVILGAGLSSPLTADPCPLSRQAGACLENPSSRSHWTEEPLCSLFGEVPGTCWSRLSTSQWSDACLWLGHMVFWTHCSPSTTFPPALQAGEIAQGSDPWRQLHAGCGSCQQSCAGRGVTGLCLEHVPLGSAAQPVWPWCWVTVPGEV